MTFFELYEVLQKDECPICFLVKKRETVFFEGLLYEGINDVGFRQKFEKTGGFCNYHSYKFLGYNDGLAVALIHRQFIESYIKTNQAHPSKKCIVCESNSENEKHYVQSFLRYLNDSEFKSRLLESEGLCMPHFEVLKQIGGKRLPTWYVEFQINRYRELLAKLDKYIASNNKGLSPTEELTRQEELIWKKVIPILFGYQGKQ